MVDASGASSLHEKYEACPFYRDSFGIFYFEPGTSLCKEVDRVEMRDS